MLGYAREWEGNVSEQNTNGSVPLDVVRQVVREEIAPLARDVTQLREDVSQLREDVTELRGNYTQLRGDVAQLAEGQKVLLEDMAEVKQVVRGHEARITTLERGQV